MLAESFIAEFCERLERARPHSMSKIGYEALRYTGLHDQSCRRAMLLTYRTLV